MSLFALFDTRLVFTYKMPVDSPIENPATGFTIEYRKMAFLSLSASVAFTDRISTRSLDNFSEIRKQICD